MTHSGDNYPGHPAFKATNTAVEVKNIAALWEAPEDVLRDWFSGQLPEEGALYALRADRIYDIEGGRKGVEMRFVRIDKE